MQKIGRRGVITIEKQLRAQRKRETGDLGLLQKDCADRKRGFADGDLPAERCAKTLCETRVDPHFATIGNASDGSALRQFGIGQRDRAAQWITRRDRFDVGEHGCVCIRRRHLHHAVEADHRRHGESASLRFGRVRVGQRPIA